ncbi:Phosphoserine phosphatase [Hartmannibacter diazotrophicus]|uniref:Phosphoserine phosphatase n=1 Tax=Hartmannibacter diazotrophicus TaxID=1482074 RepID=A0A2C9D8A6_9HYPH|nr:phosphoserine phosphatase SerB [Hartmannibacter diazotrophicus]SON56410.1 Phosphoserine phosphatase [Hartmannibacter diazotrophicus]
MPAGSLLVATLVSSQEAACLMPALVAEAAGTIAAEAAVILQEDVAADLFFEGDAATAEARLRGLIDTAPIDVVVQPAASRRKRLLLADMDSTMIGQECIDELAAEVGLKDHIAAITERAMRGEIDFEPALRERVGLLRGLDLSVVDRVIADRITLTPGGPDLVRTMRANGGYAALVSGGFTVFTGPLAARIGFNENRANLLIAEGGKLTGDVDEPILGQQAKLDSLVELRSSLGLHALETMAVGDGANDLAMIGEAGLGVAYHAKPKVAASAAARIDHADLTALLFIQGYAANDFVSG